MGIAYLNAMLRATVIHDICNTCLKLKTNAMIHPEINDIIYDSQQFSLGMLQNNKKVHL